VSAAAINSPAPINKARAIPPRTERTWWRRLAGLVLAAAVCAAKRPIQKLLMHQPKFMSFEGARHFRLGARSRSRTRVSQPRRQECVLHAKAVEASEIFGDPYRKCAHPRIMNSSGMLAHPHKHGIKVANRFDRMLMLHTLKDCVTGTDTDRFFRS